MRENESIQIDHKLMVSKLIKPGAEIAEQMCGHEAHLIHMIMGICGEAGELLDSIKKHVIYKKRLDEENIIEELGDLEFYMEGIRSALDISRELTLVKNMEKLGKRYGNEFMYTNEAAIARADKENER